MFCRRALCSVLRHLLCIRSPPRGAGSSKLWCGVLLLRAREVSYSPGEEHEHLNRVQGIAAAVSAGPAPGKPHYPFANAPWSPVCSMQVTRAPGSLCRTLSCSQLPARALRLLLLQAVLQLPALSMRSRPPGLVRRVLQCCGGGSGSQLLLRPWRPMPKAMQLLPALILSALSVELGANFLLWAQCTRVHPPSAASQSWSSEEPGFMSMILPTVCANWAPGQASAALFLSFNHLLPVSSSFPAKGQVLPPSPSPISSSALNPNVFPLAAPWKSAYPRASPASPTGSTIKLTPCSRA